MEAFTRVTGVVAPLHGGNIDTDQIIPKQFLKRIERSGYGKFLFYDWRYAGEGNPNPAFILNEPRYAGTTVLLANRNCNLFLQIELRYRSVSITGSSLRGM